MKAELRQEILVRWKPRSLSGRCSAATLASLAEFIDRHDANNVGCHLVCETIAQGMKRSIRTLRNAIVDLVALGVLEFQRPKSARDVSFYKLNWTAIENEVQVGKESSNEEPNRRDTIDEVNLMGVVERRHAKSVLREIASHDSGDVGCHLKTETIAMHVGCSERTVRRTVESLVAIGVLSYEAAAHASRPRHSVGRYKIDYCELRKIQEKAGG